MGRGLLLGQRYRLLQLNLGRAALARADASACGEKGFYQGVIIGDGGDLRIQLIQHGLPPLDARLQNLRNLSRWLV